MQRDLEPIETKGNCNYGTRSLGSAVVRGRSEVSTANKIQQGQTVEEWLEDYGL